jgi:hypothetical protein
VLTRNVFFALTAAALAGIVSYATSTVLQRDIAPTPVAEPASQPVERPDSQPVTQPASPPPAAEKPNDFHAVVERDGAVVLCVSNGETLLPDRCAGTGRLWIVQPLEEGEAVSVEASGVVAMENKSPQNPECALSRAQWDPTTERTTSTGRKLRNIPPELVAQHLNRIYPGKANLLAEDISAFGLDLNNDGHEDIIYTASNVPRIAKLHDKTGNAYPYFVQGGIFNGRAPEHPSILFHDMDEYRGGTDAIGQVLLKGIVPMTDTPEELAVLAKTGGGLSGDQSLIRLGEERLQRIDSFEFRCN